MGGAVRGSVATVVAVDLGASSGRVMLGSITDDTIRLTEAHRFGNVPVLVHGTLRWDVLRIYRGVVEGLQIAGRAVDRVDSIGIDAWGVDYGLLDRDGQLIGNPVHYRDARTERVAERLIEDLPPPALYQTTGLQFLPFNTLYQLIAAASTAELESAETLLLIPDLLSYWLTGVTGAELTISSTTQLLDARSSARCPAGARGGRHTRADHQHVGLLF
jgi:rhamnulokinase